jgi:hypothetical protein
VLALHIALGFAVRESAAISTVYAVLTVGAAFVVVIRARQIERVAAAAGYVVSAEVLWRMTGGRDTASTPWEGGKYALVALLLVAMLRFFPGWRRAIIPGLYLAMFVPGVILAFSYYGQSWREPLSFNLAGPVSIAVCVFFFSQMRPNLAGFRQALWAVVPPIVATATVVLTGTISSGTITFTRESSLATSGGYAPNQVSAVLGFGVLACLLLAVTERDRRLRFVQIGLALWFLGQALLTFGRGGVLNVIVAAILAAVVMGRRLRRSARRALVLVAVVSLAAGAAIFLVVNSYSGGKLVPRYDEVSLAKRDSIAANDLELFRDNLLTGVGVGVSQAERPANIAGEPPHTEFSRLLAEQGLFGVVAIVALGAIAVGTYLRARRGLPRAFVAALLGWSFTEMMHSATRIALISYAVGLAVAAAGLVVDDHDAPLIGSKHVLGDVLTSSAP